jgi:cob(I)alamin adenosyltransferase
MKIYTRTGDDGSTGLFGGGRIRKSDARIECYGTIDELNAAIGLAAAAVEASAKADPPANAGRIGAVGSASADGLRDWLREIQHELFNIGSHLATPGDSPSSAKLPPLDEMMVGRLEMQIDQADEQLAPLRQFILPAGAEAACRLHLARTICRRAERRIVAFAMDRPVPRLIVTYLNRLSDWLFVMARLANQRAGVEDVPWKK